MTSSPGCQLSYHMDEMTETMIVVLHGEHLETTNIDIGLSEKSDKQTWVLCKQGDASENFKSFKCDLKLQVFREGLMNVVVMFHDDSDVSLCEIEVFNTSLQ